MRPVSDSLLYKPRQSESLLVLKHVIVVHADPLTVHFGFRILSHMVSPVSPSSTDFSFSISDRLVRAEKGVRYDGLSLRHRTLLYSTQQLDNALHILKCICIGVHLRLGDHD